MRARRDRLHSGSGHPQARRYPPRACVLALLALPAALLVPVASAGAATATVHTATAPPPVSVHYEEESPEIFEGQLRAGAIVEAEFNKVAHHLHLTLRDGRHVLVDYEGHQQPALQQRLLAAGIPVTIEYTSTSSKSTHHTLRYVAAGILVVLVIVLGVLLVARRRRLSTPEGHAGAGGEPASPSSE